MPRFVVSMLRTVCFEREIVVEAPDEERAKAIAKQMAPDLVFDKKYPTEHEALMVAKAQRNLPTTKESLSPDPFDMLVKHMQKDDEPDISMR
jgi:hypothetical protein